MRAWGHNLPPQGVWICSLSRVVEKSCLFTLNVIERGLNILVERYDLFKDCEEVILWSDTGPHYRAFRFIGALCKNIIPTFRHKDELLHARVRYGLEHHAKSDCDRFFAELNGRIARTEVHSWIRSIKDLVNTFVAEAAHKNMDLCPVEIFDDYMPTVTKEEYAKKCPDLNPASFPVPLTSCYEWQVRQ